MPSFPKSEDLRKGSEKAPLVEPNEVRKLVIAKARPSSPPLKWGHRKQAVILALLIQGRGRALQQLPNICASKEKVGFWLRMHYSKDSIIEDRILSWKLAKKKALAQRRW